MIAVTYNTTTHKKSCLVQLRHHSIKHMMKHCQSNNYVFICVVSPRAQSSIRQHKVWLMNRGSSLVYRISHLNKSSRSDILNKAQRQQRVLVWWLHVARCYSGDVYVTQEKNVACSNLHLQCSVQEMDTVDPIRKIQEWITQRGCHRTCCGESCQF